MNKTFGGRFLNHSETLPIFKPSSISNLPSISLDQLQSQINGFKKKKNHNNSLKEMNMFNAKEFHVSSPFYDRMKTHKQNCKCPYHRKKKFDILPVRHTHNIRNLFHHSLDKNYQIHQQNQHFRLSNKQYSNKDKAALNSSFDNQHKRMLHTMTQNTKFKVNTRNASYEDFMKDCEYFILRKKGFSLIKPDHVIKKGAKQIFQFINNHLDYTVPKMTEWINSIQKDRDYGQFYIDRFKQMKHNYELNLSKGKHKKQTQSSQYSFRTKKFKSQNKNKNFNSNLHNSKEQKDGSNQMDNQAKQSSQEGDQDSQNQNSSNSSDENSQSRQNITLQKIVDQLKTNNKLSHTDIDDLANLSIENFKKIFNHLQNNVSNDKYSDEILKKIQNNCLNQLLRKLSNSPNSTPKITSQKSKINIVQQTIQFIKRHRANKLSILLQRNSMKSTGSKHFFGSKRNTQNAQNNNKTTNSLHSKKSSECSLSSSQKTLNQTSKNQQNIHTQNNFYAIQEENQNEDDNLHGQQKILKNLLNHGQNVRRSKLIKQQMFKFSDEDKPHQIAAQSQHQITLQKSSYQPHKGFFRKAEKYLFEVNMGKTIVNKDDSIFTAKRKVRVIKMLLKQNPNTPEAEQLKNYIKQVEERCFQKTQKDKKINLLKKGSESQSLKDQDIWKLVSLDNLGYNLIFYNLTSKIKMQDNQDLCILLHEIKLKNDKKLDNQVSFKIHLFSQSQNKRQKTKKIKEDILVQQQMRNMQFQPEIQHQDQQNILLTTKRSQKTFNNKILQNQNKQSRLSAFFKENLQYLNDSQPNFMDRGNSKANKLHFGDKKHIKKVLRYAKNNYPQTFQMYVNNSSHLANKFENSSGEQQQISSQIQFQM